jgi:hypothetical protein
LNSLMSGASTLRGDFRSGPPRDRTEPGWACCDIALPPAARSGPGASCASCGRECKVVERENLKWLRENVRWLRERGCAFADSSHEQTRLC